MNERSGFTPGGTPPPIPRTPPPAPPTPPRPPAGGSGYGQPPAPKKSLVWLWVLLGVLGVGFIAAVIGVGLFVKKVQNLTQELVAAAELVESGEVEVSDEGLMEARAGHVTEWEESSYESDGAAEVPPEGVFELVKYPSRAGDLAAYLTPDPGDGKRHPAIVWAKGGFGGIGSYFWDEAEADNDQSARAFREAGMVMMCPSWRGENDNPGRFELFMGEVDDLLAAIEYTKALPYVDPERVYLGGHSTGGTMVLLAAVSGADVRAVFSFGGAPDMEEVMSDGEGYGNTPYDLESEIDNQLRSPIRFTPFITSPVFYFEGGYSSYHDSAVEMELLADDYGVPFHAYELPGDHFDILAPITELIAKEIKVDTGEECSIQFSLDELETAWRKVHDIPLAATYELWMDEGGDLGEMIDALGDEVEADDLEDVKVMREVIRDLAGKSDDEAMLNFSIAVRPIRGSLDDQVLKYFDMRIAPIVRDWIRSRAKAVESISESGERAVLDVVETMIINLDDEAAALVLELVEAGFAGDNWSWDSVFDSLDPEDQMFEAVAAELKDAPPGGQMGERWLNRVSRLYFDEAWEGPNPFDTKVGKERLREMLAPDSEFAYTAAFGLAFVNDQTRDGLVEYGLKHPDMEIRMEVAWSDLKTDGEAGLKVLQDACLELEWSRLAVDYLEELDFEDEVPPAALAGEFAAKAKMISWLKHPNELDGMPDSLEVFDQRELYWPPIEEKIPVWLFSFTYRFDEDEPLKTGYGMVGGMTWSSFNEFEEVPTAEELYAHHCALELSRESGMDDAEEAEMTPEAASKILRDKNPGMFQD